MTCYHPIKAWQTPGGVVFNELSRHDIQREIKIPCGQCIGCRMKRASDWELRITHEAQMHPENCFITLTYGRDKLPKNSSLDHRDFQLFMKRLRKHSRKALRFYMCGEYGPETQRPHYHACMFNIDFHDKEPGAKSHSGHQTYTSETLERIWGHGRCTVQDLVPETASYCARYIMTKALGEEAKQKYKHTDPDSGEIIERKPEYAAMSLKPGIGYTWHAKYFNDVYRHDAVIQRGIERRPPKYYDKKEHQARPERFEQLQFKRELEARKTANDATTQRLKDRERVHLAKVSTLSRNIDHDAP